MYRSLFLRKMIFLVLVALFASALLSSALFNLADEERAVHCWVGAIAEHGYKAFDGGSMRELWTGAEAVFSGGGLACLVPAHGVRVFRY